MDLAAVLRESKITSLLVTHDQEEAFTVADRVAVLLAGEIRQAGAVREVWRAPVDEQVAEFLGVTTLLDGTASAGVVTCALGKAALEAPDGPVRLGLRPGALRLSGDGMAGEVLSWARRRDHVRLRVRTDSSIVDALAPVDGQVRPGDAIRLALEAEGIAIVGAPASGQPSRVLKRA